MATIPVTVEVSKEIYELGEGLGDFALAVKTALADGFSVGDDMPQLITDAVTHLIPAIEGVTLLDDEYAEDKEAAIKAALVSLIPKVFALLEDTPAPVPAP